VANSKQIRLQKKLGKEIFNLLLVVRQFGLLSCLTIKLLQNDLKSELTLLILI